MSKNFIIILIISVIFYIFCCAIKRKQQRAAWNWDIGLVFVKLMRQKTSYSIKIPTNFWVYEEASNY